MEVGIEIRSYKSYLFRRQVELIDLESLMLIWELGFGTMLFLCGGTQEEERDLSKSGRE